MAGRKKSGRKKEGEGGKAGLPVRDGLLPLVLPALLVVISFLFLRPAKDPTLVRLPVAGAVAGLVFLGLFFSRKLPSPEARLPACAFAGYLAWALVAAAFSFFPPANAHGLARITVYLSLFLAAAHLPHSRFFLPAWLGSGLVLGVMALVDAHRAGEMFYLPLMERAMPRFVTPLGNRNFFAGYIAFLAPPVLSLALWNGVAACRGGRGRAGHAAAALSFLLALLFFLFLLVKVGSRAALGGALVGLFVFFLAAAWFLLAGRLENRPARGAAGLLLGALLALVLWQGSARTVGTVRREIRWHIFAGTVEMIRSRPWTGYGPAAYTAAFQQFRPPEYYQGPAAPVTDQSHNEFLQVAAETGLPSLLFFVAGLFLAGLVSWRALAAEAPRARSPGAVGGSAWPGPDEAAGRWFLLAGFLAGVFGLLADGMLSSNLRTHTVGPLFWVVLGTCVSLSSAAGRPRPPGVSGKGPAKAGAERFWLLVCAACLFSTAVLARQVASRVYHNRGIQHRHMQNWRAAAWYYRRAMALDRSYIQGYYRLAYVLYENGDVDGAIEAYRRLLEISPNFARAYGNLGNMYLHSNRPGEAARYLRLALSYNPADREIAAMLEHAEVLAAAGPGGEADHR